MRKKLQLAKTCINCKKSGGTIFSNKNRVLSATCGHTVDPCQLDIQIRIGKWTLLPNAIRFSEDNIDSIKASIIDLKLDLLFGLRTEEEITKQFDTDKTEYKELSKLLAKLKKVNQSKNEIIIEEPITHEERRMPIENYLNVKHAELQELILQFKQYISDYLTEEDDIAESNNILQSAINLYIEQIFPLMTNIRESQYVVTMMDKEGSLFVMKQVKVLLKNLEWPYEVGEIISDKK